MNKINIYDFVKYAKLSKKYYRYCEIIIDPYGNVLEINPSHQDTVIKYAMEKENKTRKEIMAIIPYAYSPLHWCIDKYSLVAVWYNGYIHGTRTSKKPNRFQRISLEILKSNNIIQPEWVESTNEYQLYLEREVNKNKLNGG